MQTPRARNQEKELNISSSWSSSSLACSTLSNSLSSLSSSPPSPSLVQEFNKRNKKVSFSTVTCRYYDREQGGSCGVPSKGGFSLGLSWTLSEKCPEKIFLLDVYEGLIPPPVTIAHNGNGLSNQTSTSSPTSKNARKKQRRRQASLKQNDNGLVYPHQPPPPLTTDNNQATQVEGEEKGKKNHHKSRFHPNYRGRPEDSLRALSATQRKKLLTASGCKLDSSEAHKLATIREQRKDVGCLCSVVPGMGKGRTCRDHQVCECAMNDIQCHADVCECLSHHKRRKGTNCKNARHYYLYDEAGVERHRKKRIKELSH